MHLILNKPGTMLAVTDGMFHIRHEERSQVIAAHEVRSITLHRATALTHEAVMLALAHEVEILFSERTGKPTARLWSHRYGSIATIRKNQLVFAGAMAAVAWVRELLVRKADNCLGLLAGIALPYPEDRTRLRVHQDKIRTYQQKLNEVEGQSLPDVAGTLRGLEGKIAYEYFTAISEALPEQFRFERRSQHPARDMFNALLNYAYGVLYGQVEGALIRAGLDPYAGVFHRDEYNRPVLVYDCIEPYRVWADYVVLRLCMEQAMYIEFFEVYDDGAYWLGDMGKRILVQSLNDYLDEVVEVRGLSRSRVTHIDLDAQQFAAMLKTFDS